MFFTAISVCVCVCVYVCVCVCVCVCVAPGPLGEIGTEVSHDSTLSVGSRAVLHITFQVCTHSTSLHVRVCVCALVFSTTIGE